MKVSVKKATLKNWTLPGDAISLDEFKKGIKKAEKGPFHSIEESKKLINGWRERKRSR